MAQNSLLLTTGQVAEMLAVHPNTVADWAREGKLACVVLPGGNRRYKREDIEALLETHDGAPEAAAQ